MLALKITCDFKEHFTILCLRMDQVPEKDDELKWESVEKLNSDNFDGFAKDKKHLVVMFYAPCKYTRGR